MTLPEYCGADGASRLRAAHRAELIARLMKVFRAGKRLMKELDAEPRRVRPTEAAALLAMRTSLERAAVTILQEGRVEK